MKPAFFDFSMKDNRRIKMKCLSTGATKTLSMHMGLHYPLFLHMLKR
jgi:hypothetical protein